MTISEMTLMAIRQAYQIWDESGGEDTKPILDLMSDDIVVTTLPNGADPLAFTKACHGKVEMTEYLQGLIGDWCLLKAEIEDMVCERDLVVLLLNTAWQNRRTEKSFDGVAAHAWRFKDGFACQLRLFFDSARWGRAARGGDT